MKLPRQSRWRCSALDINASAGRRGDGASNGQRCAMLDKSIEGVTWNLHSKFRIMRDLELSACRLCAKLRFGAMAHQPHCRTEVQCISPIRSNAGWFDAAAGLSGGLRARLQS